MRKNTGPSQPLVMPKDLAGVAAAREAARKTCPRCAASLAVAAASCHQCGLELPDASGPKTDPWEGYDV
jgi:ribosomal protein L40E